MRALLLCNPVAARSAGRTLRAVSTALEGALDLQVAVTRATGHATELTARGVEQGCDVVIVLAGDGTMNEALQALAGSDVPLAALPAGTTNVWARRLGFPNRAPAAARVLAESLHTGSYRRVGLGMANGRWFAFSAGFGIDATVVRRVDSRPRRKRALGQLAFVSSAITTLARGYGPTAIGVKTPGAVVVEGLQTVLCANGDPFTYLGRLPLRICPGARPGGLSLLGLARVDIPTLARAVRSAAIGDVRRLPEARTWHNLDQATLTCDEPLPLQVDGDDLDDTPVVDLRHVPDALTVVTPTRAPRR